MKSHALVRALGALLPEARFTLVSSHDWHSVTFGGQRVVIECLAASGEDFARCLPDHEFSVPHMLVADIAVVSTEKVDGGERLVIEALLIEE